MVPEDALAARSGGRVGGRAFRSAPRPTVRAPRSSGSYRGGGGGYSSGGVYVAPPLYGYGGGLGYGYGGGFFGPTFFVSPFSGGLFSFVFNMILLTAAVNFFVGVAKSLRGEDSDDAVDDEFDDDKW